MFHKLSYEPYFLPFTSKDARHIKRNILVISLIRAVKYCSNYDAFEQEETHIYASLLLNEYPLHFISKHLNVQLLHRKMSLI